MGQKEIYSDYGDMGILRNIPTEILYMIFESMDVQTFLRMKRVCKSLKVCTSRSRNQLFCCGSGADSFFWLIGDR